MHDLRGFIAAVRDLIKRHEIDQPGAYRRWLWQKGESTRDLGLNPYGCADAANILYTIGYFPQSPAERQSWVATLRDLQNQQDGLFYEVTHHPIHTTAHCIAALELFDAMPAHPLSGLSQYKDPSAMEAFLDQLDWRNNPWRESHRGAGLYASLVLAGEVTTEWQDRYFAWLYDHADPATGFVRKDHIGPVPHPPIIVPHLPPSIFPHLAGSFHYLFNQQYARVPLRYPSAMVDTCLDIYRSREFPLAVNVGFAEIDWVFCLTRSLRQSGGHRNAECYEALITFTDQYVPFLLGLNPNSDEGLNDLHLLFGAMCCLAELQTALPGQLKTERPLKLVLDRRPFI